jgi:hypothetical protein
MQNYISGGPGSGKSTQCERICKTLDYSHISTGELLRCQFHQRFTYTFFVQIFWQSQNVTRKTTFVRLTLMKLTAGWINIVLGIYISIFFSRAKLEYSRFRESLIMGLCQLKFLNLRWRMQFSENGDFWP